VPGIISLPAQGNAGAEGSFGILPRFCFLLWSQILPDLLRQLVQVCFADVQFTGKTLDQSLGWCHLGIALAHEVDHIHLQRLGQILKGAGLLIAGGPGLGRATGLASPGQLADLLGVLEGELRPIPAAATG
jgi:hypothetical protein